ncbi:12540_t:CDS:2 [Rhizophagus irregularis]|nr:12540_t:CDS:2 [Rhizophagus irregularis]
MKSYHRDRIVIVCKGDIVSRQEVVQTSSQDPKIIQFEIVQTSSQDPKIIRFVKKYFVTSGNCTSQDQIIRFVKKYCVTSGNCTNLKSRSKNYTEMVHLMDAS